ncbi:MAG: zinc ABC transporter substrate-binding protein, partial [Verrucomicrobiota bacterium]
IAEELGKLSPEHADEFEGNASNYADAVFELDERLVKELASLKGSTFYVFHAAFGYFAGAYGLTQEAIETGGREPSAKHLTKLIEDAREDGVKLVLVQPQFSDVSARKIADQIGAAVLSVDPLEKDVLATLRSIADAVKASKG